MSDEDLARELAEKRRIFDYNGGRGVDLADEIDRMMIALAVRQA